MSFGNRIGNGGQWWSDEGFGKIPLFALPLCLVWRAVLQDRIWLCFFVVSTTIVLVFFFFSHCRVMEDVLGCAVLVMETCLCFFPVSLFLVPFLWPCYSWSFILHSFFDFVMSCPWLAWWQDEGGHCISSTRSRVARAEGGRPTQHP